MVFASSLNARPRPASAVRRWSSRLDLRPRHAVLVLAAGTWVVIVPAATLIGWFAGQVQMAITLLGAFLLCAVSLGSILVTVAVLAARLRGGRGRAVSVPGPVESGEPVRSELDMCLIGLSPGWTVPPKSEVLSRFLQTFESSLAALRIRLAHRLGADVAAALPLHQQIAFAEELGIWTGEDVAAWRDHLSIRTRILTQGAELPLSVLEQHTQWLNCLGRRTVSAASR
ncbi:hypothetical protein KIH74_28585 [Kineosporia sp. J2-2]|uniref:DUF2207 domain-containing protein n=1 Tax=Kineosporia corallincola TaxID=2835133 RepID=A0ABS5TQS3_9ACTN|nr:hypothetical protein [Kineosporia corallincola]MBT0772934.1 hypothetical protein [Kineosporia corallincola]